MFLNHKIMKSISDYSQKIELLKDKISTCDAIIIGAGAGLSTSAGFTYSGKRFEENFSDFIQKYHFKDMYSGGFYPFSTLEEHWAYWSRYIYINRYDNVHNDYYKTLFELVKNKDYFVITTNVDHQFQMANFDKQRLFYTQGDYGLFQCSEPCHAETYDNKDIILKMINTQKDMKIPTELIPKCPKCDKPMSVNLRADDTFIQDSGWYQASERYSNFISKHNGLNILFLELGIGYNTPSIIKYPFWNMTNINPKATYCCINFGETYSPPKIEKQSICINDDVFKVIKQLVK